ncbi:hypothetical protein BJF92_09110 [Rhizobium rhizosphaerae]|uniref:Uncharacterized protein n=1 Tax=Xaviernesmea rhizosphaerae TaxID=1672749 RepID=A0A1Q9AKG8_9HYPH|nr:hypothetical protein [Xaviernesmea rhizosphaerae]OLP55782.1 hypothetical protein BJF92_09110 [Xaviernesmea rhizosphaerae]
MIEYVTSLAADVPYRGLTTFAGRGFALDQFALSHGFHSFAEWAASEFAKGHSISGIVKSVDDLEPRAPPEPGMCATTFGYEVSIFTVAMTDKF